MSEESTFRKRFLLKLASSPWTLGPLLLGVTILMGTWTFGVKSGVAVFAGVAAILGSFGALATRLALGGDAIGQSVIAEMQTESKEERERSLDELDSQLEADGDPRTEGSLRDLRRLAKAFNENETWAKELNTRSTLDILSGVDQMFRRCVVSLEKALQIWYVARDIVTPEARKTILKKRDRIVEEVAQSIRQIGLTLAEIQTLSIEGEAGDSQLARIRSDLNQSLEVARKVEKRMASLDGDIGLGSFEDSE